MSRNTFINLPVRDLAKTTEFFTKVGFSFNQQFTDENATCMIISEETYAMLVVGRSSWDSRSRTLPTRRRAEK